MARLAMHHRCDDGMIGSLEAWRCLGAAAAVLMATCIAAGADEPHNPKGRRANRLAGSTSPYLLQHAYNPVNWFPWGDEAFDLAKKEEKPIFLSIGYAACHWCHVMERESFENEKVAEVLNEHFVCIKVDREERPDIDEIYMAATTAATGRGGWPMSIFMTPDREPFLCGTYYPPETRGRRRGFRELCMDIAERWQADRDLLLDDAGALVAKVRNIKRTDGGSKLVDRLIVSRNIARKATRFDPVLGGYRSGRNKFPPTMVMELMLREHSSQPPGLNATLLAPVETTLTQMANGGIFDQIGGGICRYSTDPRWFAPHFEKMLYDQARVAGVYLSAYQLTHKGEYARVARSILDYCLADLRDAKGGFYSSRDADSEGEEGKFYVWRRDELEKILAPNDAPLFFDYYHVRDGGNWHGGQNILYVTETDKQFATKHKLDVDEWRKRLNAMRSVVFDARSKRVAPGLDDKILTEWNGLLITQLARAYRILDEPRYRDAAVAAADFILGEMLKDGRLYRAHRNGVTHIQGYASDYTNVVEALITLYETTFDRKWLSAAEQLNDTFIKYFHDKTGGAFYYTAGDAEELLTRSKNTRDSVVPSANSTATLNLLRLAILLDRSDLRALAEQTIRTLQPLLSRGVLERMQWAILFYYDQPREIAIVGEPEDSATQALIAEVYRNYLPNKVVTMCRPKEATAENALPLLRRKKLINGKPAAYVCRDYMCRRPVTKPGDLAKQLLAQPPLKDGRRER